MDRSALPAFRTYFSPDDYSAYHQIWAITSDDENRIYVGTAEGISIFDNATWRLITTPSNTTVRSLDYGYHNQVYVGLQGDIGYISPDSTGRLKYKSLLDLAGRVPDFGNVWETHATSNGVYFQSSKYIAYWNGSTIEWSTSEAGYHTSFNIGSKIIVREKSVGLVEVDGVKRNVIAGSELFGDKRVFVLENIGDDRWLVGTRDTGFYILEEGHVRQIITDIDSVVEDHWIYGSVRLSHETIGIYTLGAGLLIINTDGRLLRSISTPTEISDRYVISAHMDRSGSIWVGTMNSGLERYRSSVLSLSVYDESLGIDGYIYDIQASEKEIVVSTGSGLHILDLSGNKSQIRDVQQFVKIDAVPIAWESAILQNNIYAVSDAGVFLIQDSNIDTLSSDQSFSLDAYAETDHIIFVGGKSKINILSVNKINNNVQVLLTQHVEGEVDLVVWDYKNRRLWANIKNTKIISLTIDQTYSKVESVYEHHYSSDDSDVNAIFNLQDTWYYATNRFIYEYNETERAFKISEFCDKLCNDKVMAVETESNDGLWIAYPDSVVYGKRTASGMSWHTPPDLLYKRSSTGAIKIGPSSIVYISERSRLYRYAYTSPSVAGNHSYSVLINEIHPARTDTIFYAVMTDGMSGIGRYQPEYMVPSVPYDQRDMMFKVSSTNYANIGPTRLEYRFAHNNDSSWVEIDGNSFTITPEREGTYRLYLRGVDDVGRLSDVAEYTFIIMPPWYRTWWSYSIYLIIVGFIGYISHRYVTLRKAHKKAEEQAKELERERVVVRKLQEANERLKEANKLKDEFLATTSHELRTPLTAILGFTSVLKEEVPSDADYREFLDIIEDSGGRLMDTLNSLLDLAKIRAGIMEINKQKVDLVEAVSNSLANLNDRAMAKGLYLKYEKPNHRVDVKADVYALSRVVYNLVSNGIKFSDTGGVTIKIRLANNKAILIVSDTGVGIDKSFIPRLFDEFMQESDGLSRTHEGSGLGLAITGRLIYMMNGKIEVESNKGKGSTFMIQLDRFLGAVDSATDEMRSELPKNDLNMGTVV